MNSNNHSGLTEAILPTCYYYFNTCGSRPYQVISIGTPMFANSPVIYEGILLVALITFLAMRLGK
jgi:hypothetical protein